MKIKKRYIAIAAFVIFSAFNAYKGWNDTEGQHKAFDKTTDTIAPKVEEAPPVEEKKAMQVTPGKIEFNEMVGTGIAQAIAEVVNSQAAQLQLAAICNSAGINVYSETCRNFMAIAAESIGFTKYGVSLPQLILNQTPEDIENDTTMQANAKRHYYQLYLNMGQMLATKLGTELLVAGEIMTADESAAIREMLDVTYTDKALPDFSDSSAPVEQEKASEEHAVSKDNETKAVTRTCDAEFSKGHDVVRSEDNYVKVTRYPDYFSYVTIKGKQGDSTGNNAYDANQGKSEPKLANKLVFDDSNKGWEFYNSKASIMQGDKHVDMTYQETVQDGEHHYLIVNKTLNTSMYLINCH